MTEYFQTSPSDNSPETDNDHDIPHYPAIVYPRQASHMLSTNTTFKEGFSLNHLESFSLAREAERRAILVVPPCQHNVPHFSRIKVLFRIHRLKIQVTFWRFVVGVCIHRNTAIVVDECFERHVLAKCLVNVT